MVAVPYSHLFENQDFGDRELTGLTDFIHERLFRLGPESVLDVGSGTGHLAQWIARSLRTVRRVVGIDISQKMVGIAAASNESDRVSYIKMAAERLKDMVTSAHTRSLVDPPDRSAGAGFEVVVVHLSLMDVYDLRAVLAGIARHLNPGGKLMLTLTNPMAGFLRTPNYREAPVVRVTHRCPSYVREFWKKGIFVLRGKELPFVYVRHRPFSTYLREMLAAGLVISDVRDHFIHPSTFEPVYFYIEGETGKCT